MMNLTFRSISAAALTLAAVSAFATDYPDATDDIAVSGFPYPQIDITGVKVTNTLTDITFEIGLNGSPIATNWGKYNIILNSPGGGIGDTSTNGNGWGRPYSLNGGANRFIGGWADQAVDNAQVWSYSGGVWNLDTTLTSTVSASSITYTIPLATLGLVPGDAFLFDVATTGGGSTDSAVDALSSAVPQIGSWDEATVLAGQTYAVAAVPEPASLAALALGIAALRRRRRGP